MKINISSLMSLISEEEKKFNNLCFTIRDYAISTSCEELDGRVNIIEDNKEVFLEELKMIEEINSKLSKLKATLYEKNNSFKLSDGRTIQEAIVDNTNLRKLKDLYENLLTYKSNKKRYTEVNNSYFEVKTINYDVKRVKERLEKINKDIQTTEFEISKLNSIEFEI